MGDVGDVGEGSGESQGEIMVVLDEVRVTMMGAGDCMRRSYIPLQAQWLF